MKVLRLVYSDHVSSFDELLKKDRSFSIHARNIQSLAIESYMLFSRLFSKYHEIHLNTNIPYKPRSRSGLYCRNPKTVRHETEAIFYLAPKI